MAISKYMAWYLGGNMNTELFLSAAIEAVGETLASELFPTYPDNAPVIVSSADGEPVFSAGDIPALVELSRIADLNDKTAFVPGLGSNNWVISGTKTASGAALLANDMHLGLGVPSIWYANHLILKGDYNVTGVIFPGIPGVIVGFNDHIAWGVTNTGPDVQDLYLITLNPDNPHQYLYMDEWVDGEVVVNEITIKGEEEPYRLEVLITRHGPVISDVVGLDQPISLRWTALEATGEMEAVLGFYRATNWEEFCTALEGFMAPAQNFVFADRDGNIGYQAEMQALALFADWLANPVEEAVEAGPAIFNMLYLQMLDFIFADELGEDLFERFLHSRGVSNTLDRMLLDPEESVWFNNINTADIETRDQIIVAAFQNTVKELSEKLGTEVERWQWGDLHTVTFNHDRFSASTAAFL